MDPILPPRSGRLGLILGLWCQNNYFIGPDWVKASPIFDIDDPTSGLFFYWSLFDHVSICEILSLWNHHFRVLATNGRGVWLEKLSRTSVSVQSVTLLKNNNACPARLRCITLFNTNQHNNSSFYLASEMYFPRVKQLLTRLCSGPS